MNNNSNCIQKLHPCTVLAQNLEQLWLLFVLEEYIVHFIVFLCAEKLYLYFILGNEKIIKCNFV